jgi:hypothetical protein
MWDFGNNLNWDLALRQTYNAQGVSSDDPDLFLPIPRITVPVSSRVLLIGAKNQFAKPNWFLAARVSPRLLFSPSSTSEFIAAIDSYPRVKIGLDRLNLIRFDNYDLSTYLLEINIPKWHKQILLEIWQYSGEMGDIETSLARIESKINAMA